MLERVGLLEAEEVGDRRANAGSDSSNTRKFAPASVKEGVIMRSRDGQSVLRRPWQRRLLPTMRFGRRRH
jgi:hypothetical protein